MDQPITEHAFVTLARQAIETYLSSNKIIDPPNPVPVEMAQPGAVFVSLHTADGLLRGCRGTILATEPTLAEEIIKTAIASATDDPRFLPMTLAETKGLDIKVDLLSPLEPVQDEAELDEKVYGVLIQAGYRRALLLPDIAAVDSVPRQLPINLVNAYLDVKAAGRL